MLLANLQLRPMGVFDWPQLIILEIQVGIPVHWMIWNVCFIDLLYIPILEYAEYIPNILPQVAECLE